MKWLLPLTAGALMAADTNWPQWRGPSQHGSAPTARNLPVQWSETEGLRWKTKMPSWSAATPVIWGDTIYVTTAEAGFASATYETRNLRRAGEPTNDKIFLLALRRKDGSEKWRVTIEQRRGGVAVVDADFTVVGHQIALPDLFARRRVAADAGVPGGRPDVLAIGNR